MNSENDIIWLSEKACLCNEALVILQSNDSPALFDEPNLDMQDVGDYRIAPWGNDNDLPQRVMGLIEKAEIVGTNANFNWRVMYGLGTRLVKVVRDKDTNRAMDFIEQTNGEAYDWYMRNNVPLLTQEIMSDISHFANAFPVLLPDKRDSYGRRHKIDGIIHREAMFSRWGVNKKDLINAHLYSSKWDENPTKSDIQASYVIDEYNAVEDIRSRLKIGKDARLCFPIYIPSPGRPYYSYPSWWSIFRSGWYDQLTNIPTLKKAILKYNLGVKHIIYIADEYFKDKEELLGISKDDHEARKKLYDDVIKQIGDVLAGEENAGKAIISKKKLLQNGNGMALEKLIEVETIKNDISGGEYLTDYETCANIISYAMDVHPSLIGAVPGKNSNSLSGSNIREIFIMKQSLSKPLAYLALQWWPVVREVNGWDRDLEIVIQDSLFTTLDQSKSGEIRTQNNITQ